MAQVTDGDNDAYDNVTVDKIIREWLQQRCQYIAYVEVDDPDPAHIGLLGMFAAAYSAWPIYVKLANDFKNIVAKQVYDQSDVWKVFRDLFSK